MRQSVLANPDTITVNVPMDLRRQGGRKILVTPAGTSAFAPGRASAQVDNAVIKAIARAFRWRKLIETGVYATVQEIAAAEKINDSYVGRVLRLTLLEPSIVEAILDGRRPVAIGLRGLLRPFPLVWEDQRRMLAGQDSTDRGSALCPERCGAIKSAF